MSGFFFKYFQKEIEVKIITACTLLSFRLLFPEGEISIYTELIFFEVEKNQASGNPPGNFFSPQ